MLSTHVLTLCSAIGITVLYVLWFYSYKAYRIDEFRFRMFSLRDHLFDYATQNRELFHHPSYLSLRQMMNGSIRYAHNMSFWVFLYVIFHKDTQKFSENFNGPWEKNQDELMNLEPSISKVLRDFHNQYKGLLLEYMIKKSLFFFVITEIVLIFAKAVSSINRWRNSKENSFRNSSGMRVFEERCYKAAP